MKIVRSGIFVTGTDTEVGKTFISSLLVKGLRDYGIDAGYFKGVLSGAIEMDGKLIPGDAHEVCEMSGLKEEYNNMVSYTLRNPYSPHLAAHIEEVDINLQKIISDYKNMMEKYEFLVVEGSGGIVCPIKIEGDEIILLEDIIRDLGLSTILVARASLGTINHTILTVNHLKSIGIEVTGIIINGYDEDDIIHKNNKKVIERLTGITNICTVSNMDKNSIDEGTVLNILRLMKKANI